MYYSKRNTSRAKRNRCETTHGRNDSVTGETTRYRKCWVLNFPEVENKNMENEIPVLRKALEMQSTFSVQEIKDRKMRFSLKSKVIFLYPFIISTMV